MVHQHPIRGACRQIPMNPLNHLNMTSSGVRQRNNIGDNGGNRNGPSRCSSRCSNNRCNSRCRHSSWNSSACKSLGLGGDIPCEGRVELSTLHNTPACDCVICERVCTEFHAA